MNNYMKSTGIEKKMRKESMTSDNIVAFIENSRETEWQTI